MELVEATREGGVDLISELPDSLLHHILSFLDMTYVFQTSFLSRRWRYVWTCLPILNLDANVYNRCLLNRKSSCMGIHNFVDRLLYVRDQKSHIQTFRFLATDQQDDHRPNFFRWNASVFGQVYTWIHLLVRQNVKELDLQVGMMEDSLCHAISFPKCLFTCQSLTTLTLGVGQDYPWMFNLRDDDDDDDDLAGIMSLPALKTLHLKSFTFCMGKKSTQNLFSSSVCCPVLETLIISCCRVEKSSCHEDDQLTISALQLKNLIITDDGEWPSNEYSRIEVFAPKLTSFRCRDKNFNDYSFVDISSLMNAEIETIYGSHCYGSQFYENCKWMTQQQLVLLKESYIGNVIKCLGAIRNVRSLVLSTWLLEDVYNFHNGGAHFEKKERVHTIGLSSLLKEFWNLSFLKLRTSFSRDHYGVIKYLLEKCPNVETLVFERAKLKEVKCSKPKKVEIWNESLRWQCKLQIWNESLRWQCKLDHLKVVEIQNIIGSLDELKFLQFLLMDIDAVVLKKMVVHTSGMKEAPSDFTAKTFMEELLKFPRASSLTKISFI